MSKMNMQIPYTPKDPEETVSRSIELIMAVVLKGLWSCVALVLDCRPADIPAECRRNGVESCSGRTLCY